MPALCPDATGKPGQSGVYELCWDVTGSYTDAPALFRGFYYPEAVIVKEREGAATVRRPKAARKNIPNAFFDHLLPRERLSVIRVVGALLFYSIQCGPGGERRMPVSRSITALSRLYRTGGRGLFRPGGRPSQSSRDLWHPLGAHGAGGEVAVLGSGD